MATVRATGNRRKRMLAVATGTLLLCAATVFTFIVLQDSKTKTPSYSPTLSITPGDPIFESTLRQALAVQLEQSPFLKVTEDEQTQRDLRLMSIPPSARITNEIVHAICSREGAAATIEGTIADFGKSYLITLQDNCMPR